MKPSFFSKQSKGPSDLDTLRDTIKLLSLRIGHLERELLEKQQPTHIGEVVTPLQHRQLEGDFIMSQTRIQAFHESIASVIQEMNAQLQSLELRLSVFEKRFAIQEQITKEKVSENSKDVCGES